MNLLVEMLLGLFLKSLIPQISTRLYEQHDKVMSRPGGWVVSFSANTVAVGQQNLCRHKGIGPCIFGPPLFRMPYPLPYLSTGLLGGLSAIVPCTLVQLTEKEKKFQFFFMVRSLGDNFRKP